jgi:hypothetical protein
MNTHMPIMGNVGTGRGLMIRRNCFPTSCFWRYRARLQCWLHQAFLLVCKQARVAVDGGRKLMGRGRQIVEMDGALRKELAAALN